MPASQRGPWRRRQAFSVSWASRGLQLVNTQWHWGQRTPGPRRLLDLPLRIAPCSLPFSWPPCPTPKRLVWFFILGSSLPWPTPALPVPSFVFLSPALHPWLSASGPASKGWVLLLPPSLPFPSLGRVPGPTCSLLSSVISQPYGAMTGLFPLCPPEASSEQQPGTEYTSQPLTRSDFWSWASWVWEAAERESTGSENKTWVHTSPATDLYAELAEGYDENSWWQLTSSVGPE